MKKISKNRTDVVVSMIVLLLSLFIFAPLVVSKHNHVVVLLFWGYFVVSLAYRGGPSYYDVSLFFLIAGLYGVMKYMASGAYIRQDILNVQLTYATIIGIYEFVRWNIPITKQSDDSGGNLAGETST